MPQYTKPYLSVQDQLALLKGRGMVITDDAKALAYLTRIGYYRLSGYWYPLRKSRLSNGTRVVEDQFRDGTTFANVIDLYVFDKKLRLLMLDGIERIEVGLRVEVALLLGQKSPWAHREPAQLHGSFAKINLKTNRTLHDHWLEKLDDQMSRSSEDFVKHFTRTYSDPLPIWIAIELWDFGLLSTFIANMAHADQTALAAKYNLPRPELLKSWARTLNHVRNICAHHSRLWNRALADQPVMPRMNEIADLEHLRQMTPSHSRLYAAAAIMQYLLHSISPGTTWGQRLEALLLQFPQLPGNLNVSGAGFPPNWRALPLWQ